MRYFTGEWCDLMQYSEIYQKGKEYEIHIMFTGENKAEYLSLLCSHVGFRNGVSL